jgi:hypothetical protein
MTSQIKIQAEVECDTCGDVAVTEFVGGGGSVYPLCEGCDAHLRETLEGAYDEVDEVYGQCEDCRGARATRWFCHLDGRRFLLCNGCYSWADHEDDYLMFCECRNPQGEEGLRCDDCKLHIRSAWGPEPEAEREEPYIEEQEDDFLAEEPESDDDFDDRADWATDDWCADSV